MPFATVRGSSTGIIDALFTATSAVCVTGLIVVDTGRHFSTFGQMVILILIQIGGLGYMTMATLMVLFLGRKISLRSKVLVQQALDRIKLQGIVQYIIYILKVTLLFEAIGAVILLLHWTEKYGLLKAGYWAVFHSISAFCNAGFSLFSTNLLVFANDGIVTLVIALLFITGGLGYIVLFDLYRYPQKKKLSTHSKLVLTMTSILILTGVLCIFIFEYNNPQTLAGASVKTKLLSSFFQGVTPRTAGFSTMNISSMRYVSIFFIMILMFIGASPGGTGGGIKTTTFAAGIASVWNTLRGKNEVNLFERRIPVQIILKTFAVIVLGIMLIIGVTTVLLITEKMPLSVILFEVVSAFGTVGLSAARDTNLSLSSMFSIIGKLLIIITMFVGRLGPITIGTAMVQEDDLRRFKYVQEKIIIG